MVVDARTTMAAPHAVVVHNLHNSKASAINAAHGDGVLPTSHQPVQPRANCLASMMTAIKSFTGAYYYS